jgi:hypothetical protein
MNEFEPTQSPKKPDFFKLFDKAFVKGDTSGGTYNRPQDDPHFKNIRQPVTEIDIDAALTDLEVNDNSVDDGQDVFKVKMEEPEDEYVLTPDEAYVHRDEQGRPVIPPMTTEQVNNLLAPERGKSRDAIEEIKRDYLATGLDDVSLEATTSNVHGVDVQKVAQKKIEDA